MKVDRPGQELRNEANKSFADNNEVFRLPVLLELTNGVCGRQTIPELSPYRTTLTAETLIAYAVAWNVLPPRCWSKNQLENRQGGIPGSAGAIRGIRHACIPSVSSSLPGRRSGAFASGYSRVYSGVTFSASVKRET